MAVCALILFWDFGAILITYLLSYFVLHSQSVSLVKSLKSKVSIWRLRSHHWWTSLEICCTFVFVGMREWRHCIPPRLGKLRSARHHAHRRESRVLSGAVPKIQLLWASGWRIPGAWTSTLHSVLSVSPFKCLTFTALTVRFPVPVSVSVVLQHYQYLLNLVTSVCIVRT